MSDERETLLEGVRRLALAEQSARSGELPDPDDLVAYRDGKLGDGARESLERKLALDPAALQEYLDLVDPSRWTAPQEGFVTSDEDLGQAFASLSRRLEDERPEAPDSDPEPRPSLASGSRNARKLPPGLWVSAVAATILLVIAGLWISRLQRSLAEQSSPRFAAILDVHPTRGARSTPVSADAGELLLVFHDIDLGTHSQGQLEILASDGRSVLVEEIRPSPDERSLLYLPIRQEHMPYGTYQVKIFAVGQGRRQLVQDYSLNLVPPDSRSRE